MLIEAKPKHNPTAVVTTSPGSVLRDRDFTAAGCLSSQRNAARNRTRMRVARTSAYVGCAGKAGFARPGDDEEISTPDIRVNGGKPRSEFQAILKAVQAGRMEIADPRINAKWRRQIRAILKKG